MFEIVKITPSMTHQEKVYEYARRLDYYSRIASSERSLSRVFTCQNTERNKELFGEECGCFKRGANDNHEPCQPCINANAHYLEFRSMVSKKAAALRQLQSEFRRNK